jgi:type VI secretion system protein ImpA
MSRVTEILSLMDRAISSLLSNRPSVSSPTAHTSSEKAMQTEPTHHNHVNANEPAMMSADLSDQMVDPNLPAGPIRSRADAYKQLEIIANFLQSIEPHSPTPYLVRRAVSWGRMPLPELMQEVLREEGDLNRLFTVLGLKAAE